MSDARRPIRLGVVGIGKIARDQHLPAIAGNPGFELVAVASRNASVDGVANHKTIAEMLAGGHDLDAVSLCTPPAERTAFAIEAIDAGLAVMIEKPPAATLAEIADLTARAEAGGTTLFASWHSRGAAGVEEARAWLAKRPIDAARITWKEDIRHWHPGQEWILAAGGFGVFDPGINALSILTRILPGAVIVESAKLTVPEGRGAPIAAEVAMRMGRAPISVELDFLQTGPQSWDIEVDTTDGTLKLAMGGSVLTLPGQEPREAPDREYPTLYAHFAELIAGRRSDVDIAPLRLVADAFMIGERAVSERFEFYGNARRCPIATVLKC